MIHATKLHVNIGRSFQIKFKHGPCRSYTFQEGTINDPGALHYTIDKGIGGRCRLFLLENSVNDIKISRD